MTARELPVSESPSVATLLQTQEARKLRAAFHVRSGPLLLVSGLLYTGCGGMRRTPY
jgi:hypothetical protein